MRQFQRSSGIHRLGTVGAILLSLALGASPVSGAADGFGRYRVVGDSHSGQQQLQLTATDRVRLETVERTLLLPLPDLDLGTTIGMLIFGRTSGATPSGRMHAAVFREGSGEPRELVGRGRDQLDGSGAAVRFLLSRDELAAGDTLAVRITFTGDTKLREGDSLFLSASWFTSNVAAPRRGPDQDRRDPAMGVRATDELDVSFEDFGGGRRLTLSTTNGTPLRGLDRELELPIPDLTQAPDADELLLQADALVLSAQADSPEGRMRIVFWRLPADGGPRELLHRSSAKLDFFRSGVGVPVPIPAGLGLGDRIVARVFFKTDWRFLTASGVPSVIVNASWTLPGAS